VAQLMVVKRDNRRQPFNREKLRSSIQTACAKRPISSDTIERMVEQIEAELRSREGLEVASTVIGDHVVERLRAVDHVAYIRFASVYRSFADVSSFEDELRRLVTS
jgi:transcriptional repressor NrdR